MIGIVVATRVEAEALLAALAARPLADEPFEAYVFDPSAGRAGGAVVISGMGKAAAAEATAWLLDSRRPESVLNVGVCGALSEAVDVGGVYRIVEAVDGDAPPETAPIAADACDGSPWRHLPAARLATVAEPVFQADRRRSLAARADVVDMEGAAVLDVCRRRGVPCCLLKGVTDLADRAGKDDIQRNIADVSRRLAERVVAGLVAPAAPASLGRKVLRFAKVEHTLFSLPLLLAGAWLGSGGVWPAWRVLGLIALAGVGARTFGMAMNRILDRRLDALNARTAGRELPSGAMSLAAACGVAGAGLGLYLLACWAISPICLALSPVPAVPLAVYALLKRFTPLCHFGIGLCLALAPLGAFVAASGGVAFSAEAILLAAFAFCWISGADIVYALQDLESDRLTGVHSIPVSLGAGLAQVVAAGVHVACIAALAAMWWRMGSGMLSGVAAGAATAMLAAGYVQRIPVAVRFFPIFTLAGVAGALTPLLGELQ